MDSMRRLGGDAVGELGDGEEVFGALLDLGADLHLAAALAVVVFGEVGGAARGEVGEDAEGFSLEVVDRRAAEVVEVVREDLGREADRDAVGALEEDDGELGGEGDGLLVAAVVAELPGGGLRVEEDVLGEIGQAGLDVTRGGGIVAGEGVAVVALGLDEPGALADGDERGADGGVAVRVELHRGADDVGDLVEAAVVHVPEGVEDAALDGLQAVVDVRDGAVEDDVARVVEKPVAVGWARGACSSWTFWPFGRLGGGGFSIFDSRS
jgi:hypothetical protein